MQQAIANCIETVCLWAAAPAFNVLFRFKGIFILLLLSLWHNSQKVASKSKRAETSWQTMGLKQGKAGAMGGKLAANLRQLRQRCEK